MVVALGPGGETGLSVLNAQLSELDEHATSQMKIRNDDVSALGRYLEHTFSSVCQNLLLFAAATLLGQHRHASLE